MRAAQQKKAAGAVTKLDRLLFAVMGWALLPSHVRILRYMDGWGPHAVTYNGLRLALPGMSYGSIHRLVGQLQDFGLVKARVIPAANMGGGKPARAIVIMPKAKALLDKARQHEAAKREKELTSIPA